MGDIDTSGILLIDKPSGISSFDIIRALRRQTGVRKIGHAGTLDPSATGLMIMLFGKATKQATQLIGHDKTYGAEMTLGFNSSTGDREGDLTSVSAVKPSRDEVEAAISKFIGDIEQVPSQYSAIKINGVRAYKMAREGTEVVMPPRQVTIHSIELLSYEYPIISIETSVSSGTYIRSLAQDIGAELGTGAFLSGLRRTRIGDYVVDNAAPLVDVNSRNLTQLFI